MRALHMMPSLERVHLRYRSARLVYLAVQFVCQGNRVHNVACDGVTHCSYVLVDATLYMCVCVCAALTLTSSCLRVVRTMPTY